MVAHMFYLCTFVQRALYHHPRAVSIRIVINCLGRINLQNACRRALFRANLFNPDARIYSRQMKFQKPFAIETLDALTDALHPDPFYAALTPEGNANDAWREILRAYFAVALDEARVYGIVELVRETRAGAAIWLLPQAEPVAEKMQERKNAALEKILTPRGFENYRAIIAAMTPHAERVVPRDAWYLSILGIAPHLQNQGLGAQLLAPTLALADAQRVPCYLETFNARTLRFYERAGFRIAAQHAEHITQSAYWIMVRDAR